VATEPASLRIADVAPVGPPRCSSGVIRVRDRDYRIDFWPDREWDRILPGEQPEAGRASTDDGWFSLSPMPASGVGPG
jgi:hypothetical protein